MKIIQNAAIGVCLLTSVAVHAQTSDDTATKFTPPVIVKDKAQAAKGEKKKAEYKSKQWKQGMEVMNDTTTGAGEKTTLHKRRKVTSKPAPPPPPALPAEPPANP